MTPTLRSFFSRHSKQIIVVNVLGEKEVFEQMLLFPARSKTIVIVKSPRLFTETQG
jgi:hypothetical protein